MNRGGLRARSERCQVVEFAVQQRRAGKSIMEAATEGARLRFRPVMMTSFAFILGLLPLVIAVGPSALSRRAGKFTSSWPSQSEPIEHPISSLVYPRHPFGGVAS